MLEVLKESILDVIKDIQDSIEEAGINSQQSYDDFVDKSIETLNKYMCFVHENSKGYILYRGVIHEEILKANEEKVDVHIPRYLVKTPESLMECFKVFRIPDGVRHDKKGNFEGLSYKKIPIVKVWIDFWII